LNAQGKPRAASGDWWNVENLHDVGYPTAEVFEDGRVVISKPAGTGGRISRDTLKEQILYEIHDPTSYITPDVIVDLSGVNLVDIGPHQVELSGVKGKPAPASLKLIMGMADGYMASAQLAYSWPYALAKARMAGDILEKRIETEQLNVDELFIEYVGVNSIGGPTAPIPADEHVNEVTLRAAIRCADKRTAAEFRKLFTPLALNTGPFVGGLRGTSHVGELLRQWSCLVPRTLLDGKVKIDVVTS
jgi:Acyclic terpene utilisation family protein AtuA